MMQKLFKDKGFKDIYQKNKPLKFSTYGSLCFCKKE